MNFRKCSELESQSAVEIKANSDRGDIVTYVVTNNKLFDIESTYNNYYSLNIANKAKEQMVETWVQRILEKIKLESEKGKTEARLWLNDYDEFYGDNDFNIIVKKIQSKLYKHNIQVLGDWSTLNETLYIHLRWDKHWKWYWFFGKRRYYA